MLFNSYVFILAFLPVTLLVYFGLGRLPERFVLNKVFLVLASFVFYGYNNPSYVPIIVISILVNYMLSQLMLITERRALRLPLMLLGLLANLGVLFYFKYHDFFYENLNSAFGFALSLNHLALPLGISFFTFQQLSYVIDSYRRTVPRYNILDYTLFVTFFPQLIAGPIVRYSVVEQEIDNRSVNATDLCEGALRVILGLAKKVIIANNLWSIVNTFFGKDITGLSVLGTWYTIIVYSLYVYFDFSGYSDIAIGLGRMFGFHFDENFRHPFACTTIAEFWQRWHISLGSFFRDYLLYVPFFGKPRKYFGLFLVWFCTGLWHGAAWNFILWGLYYGCFMLFEQKMGKKRMKKWPIVWKHVYTKLVIILGFGIFYFEDLGQLGQFFLNITGISMIANGAPFTDPMTFSSLRNNIFLILFAILVSLPVLPKIKSYFLESKNDTVYTIGRVGSVAVCMVLLAVVSVLLVDTTNNVLLYFRF